MPGPPKKLKKKLVLKDVESTPPPIPEPVSNPVIETVKEEELYKKEDFESNDIELKNREELTRDENEYSYLYPNIDDPNFNIKITERKEFFDTRYDGTIKDVEEYSDKICNAEFELAPHQLFVRNFLSFQTPYNSLLLYHGLGTGKTCSAISVAEEMRDYLKQMGIVQRIIVVASPNVQDNFKLQLFDERKLQLIDGLWNIKSCTGNKYLKEINPMTMKGLSKEKVIRQIKRIINVSYLFLGYIEFSNYISKKSQVKSDVSDKIKASIVKKKLKNLFNNRLIIIDEIHNIRISDDNQDKRVAQELYKLVQNVDHLRLLLLSATPMYNSYKEIIWLVNLMNMNDKRSTIDIKNVFNNDGSFKMNDEGEEIGRELLARKATGYVSFVRGDNPYTFPYRIWPMEFAPDNTFSKIEEPVKQLNGRELVQNIEMLSLYLTNNGEVQQKGYDYIISTLYSDGKNPDVQLSFENMEAFGYTLLQKPLESLNIVYPDDRLDQEDIKFDPKELVGKTGLARIMKSVESSSTLTRSGFEYKTEKYGRIFSPAEIGKYSGKIKSICDQIIGSTGVVMIYSQYIDGGLVPIALALEELGFTRGGNVNSLFKTPPTERIDALTFKPQSEMESDFNPARYAMITGDKSLSPNNVDEFKLSTDTDNRYGKNIKVVLISQAGSEGLDFKFIRQVHILEPWYNMNRIEQIIGRAVRNCSHKNLPFKERNVQIFLHGSINRDKSIEAADIYVYRLAEVKALQIGLVSRLLKEISVDCLLNFEQMGFTVEQMQQTVKQLLSNGKIIDYAIGDRPYTAICDYMSKCSYTCNPTKKITEEDTNLDTFSEAFILMNTDKIIQKIKDLMKERFFYYKADLIKYITIQKEYPLVQINAALNQLVEDKNEYITDKYGRLGNLINIDTLYLFQPIELTNHETSIYDRSVPLEFKRTSLQIDLPNQISESIIVEPDKKNLVDMEAAVTLLARLQSQWTEATTEQLVPRGNKSWYKFCSLVIKQMEDAGIEKKLVLSILRDRMIEELEFEDQLLLLNYYERNKDNTFLEGLIEYFKEYEMKEKKTTGILLQNKGILQLVVASKKQEQVIWQLGQGEDYIDLEAPIIKIKDSLLPIKSKLNSLVGFMISFKKEFMVFKVKDLTGVRASKALRVDQAGKNITVKLLNDILGKELYTTESKINQKVLCIMIEFYLRLFQKEFKNNKTWFLTPSEAILVNIEKV